MGAATAQLVFGNCCLYVFRCVTGVHANVCVYVTMPTESRQWLPQRFYADLQHAAKTRVPTATIADTVTIPAAPAAKHCRRAATGVGPA
jgi:hypothetical protein